MVHSSILLILPFALVCVSGGLGVSPEEKKVNIKLFYECLCPHCITEYGQELMSLVEEFGDYINLYTAPFGNGHMHEENGTTVITCQHGEPECYGNKLHACAIDLLKEMRAYVAFNGCMIKRNSTDSAADYCGDKLNVDSKAIQECAKGKKGHELLKHYGEVSKKAGFKHVPHILIFDKLKSKDQTLKDVVCSSLVKRPKKCQTHPENT